MSEQQEQIVLNPGGLTQLLLMSAGYKRFDVAYENQWLNHSNALFQKRLFDTNGDTAFFINIFWYDWSREPRMPFKEGWQIEVQFNSHGEQSPTFNVTLMDRGMTPQMVEDFMWRIYRTMDCQPYETKGGA